MSLKPCPFCGGEAFTRMGHDYYTDDIWYVCCRKCGCEVGADDRQDEATAAWNRRASSWVSVDDRLPVIGPPPLYCEDNFLASGPNIGAWEVVLYDGRWWMKNYDDEAHIDHLEVEVTHWMPLPEPPA